MEWFDEWLVWGWIALGLVAAVGCPWTALAGVGASQVWLWWPPEDQPLVVAVMLGCGLVGDVARWRRRGLGGRW